MTLPATAAASTEQRTFRVSPALLLDYITRQAGTIEKAVCEGAMNSVDAGATGVDVDVSEDGATLTIVDDGRGFQTRREIEQHFEMFGTPHVAGDATYGRFRLGRGQLFAFGVNVWESGPFRMRVDLSQNGEAWTLEANDPPTPGCRISIALTEPLLPSGIEDLRRSLERMLTYVPIPVRFKGKDITKKIDDVKWTHSTDDAHVRLSPDTGCLRVFNQGVFVREFWGSDFGIGGEVVSKRALELNVARNDVMSTDETWKRLRALIKREAGTAIAKKAVPLTDSERTFVAQQFAGGDLSGKDFATRRALTDVTGEHLSLQSLIRRIQKNGLTAVTVAPRHDHRGDVLQQQSRAYVIAEDVLERFGVSTLRDLIDKFRAAEEWPFDDDHVRVLPYDELVAGLDSSHVIVPESKLTPTEKLMLSFLAERQRTVAMLIDMPTRRLHAGESDSARAWTDGSSYIAFHRRFLKDADVGVDDWVALGKTMLHEFAHDQSTEPGHVHSPDFFQTLDRWTDDVLPRFVNDCVVSWPRALKTAERALGREILRIEDRLTRARRGSWKVSTQVDAVTEARSKLDTALNANDAERAQGRDVAKTPRVRPAAATEQMGDLFSGPIAAAPEPS
jgi:hypothetical protein